MPNCFSPWRFQRGFSCSPLNWSLLLVLTVGWMATRKKDNLTQAQRQPVCHARGRGGGEGKTGVHPGSLCKPLPPKKEGGSHFPPDFNTSQESGGGEVTLRGCQRPRSHGRQVSPWRHRAPLAGVPLLLQHLCMWSNGNWIPCCCPTCTSGKPAEAGVPTETCLSSG